MEQSHLGKIRAAEIRGLGLSRGEVGADFWLVGWSQTTRPKAGSEGGPTVPRRTLIGLRSVL